MLNYLYICKRPFHIGLKKKKKNLTSSNYHLWSLAGLQRKGVIGLHSGDKRCSIQEVFISSASGRPQWKHDTGLFAKLCPLIQHDSAMHSEVGTSFWLLVILRTNSIFLRSTELQHPIQWTLFCTCRSWTAFRLSVIPVPIFIALPR